jgi:hypothetical protein
VKVDFQVRFCIWFHPVLTVYQVHELRCRQRLLLSSGLHSRLANSDRREATLASTRRVAFDFGEETRISPKSYWPCDEPSFLGKVALRKRNDLRIRVVRRRKTSAARGISGIEVGIGLQQACLAFSRSASALQAVSQLM